MKRANIEATKRDGQARSDKLATVAVSTGGGQACHSRVQIRETARTPWRYYGRFQRIDQAEDCVRELHERGRQARLVRFAIAPVAG